MQIDSNAITLKTGDFLTEAKDIEGWMVESSDGTTVALDTTRTPELIKEGIAREFVNRVQNLRKAAGFDVTDRIYLGFNAGELVQTAIEDMIAYVTAETLTARIDRDVDELEHRTQCEIDGEVCEIGISKV